MQKAVTNAEERLAALEDKAARLAAALASPALYDGSIADGATKAAHLRQEQARLARAIAETEENWIAAHEALERAREELSGS
ncbi:MAG: hypothetical protein ACE5ED_09830 [Rhodothalassiaceae bacterium]